MYFLKEIAKHWVAIAIGILFSPIGYLATHLLKSIYLYLFNLTKEDQIMLIASLAVILFVTILIICILIHDLSKYTNRTPCKSVYVNKKGYPFCPNCDKLMAISYPWENTDHVVVGCTSCDKPSHLFEAEDYPDLPDSQIKKYLKPCWERFSKTPPHS